MIKVDPTAALTSGIQIPDVQYATGTTTTTFTAGQLTGANFTVYLNTGATPGSIATRTAAQMFADIPNATAGFTYTLRIVNAQGTGTLTPTAGSGVTLSAVNSGATTVAVNSWRDYVVSFSDSVTATMKSIATGTWS